MSYATTLEGVVSRVRRQHQVTHRPTVFTLSASYTADGDTFNLNGDTSHIGEGSIAELGFGLYYITAVGSGSITVAPGWEGTTSADGAENDFVEIDPRIPRSSLADMAEAEIRSWAGQLWRVTSVDLDVGTAERAYDLGTTDDVTFLLGARFQPIGNTGWSGDTWPKAKAQLLRGMPTADFASGQAIQLENVPTVATSLRVTYATPFDLSTFTASTDLVADCGLTVGQLDVLDAGLRWRLLSSGLVTRTDTQAAGMSRKAEEATALDIIRAADMARSLRDRRLADEANELRRQWPMGG
jgi:hypothetical protein